MGIDCEFNVKCYKETFLTHKFTTETPWKETKEFTNQGYKAITTTSTEVLLQKKEYVSEPNLNYFNRLSFIEPIQELYNKKLPIYSNWCHWSFCYSIMSGKERFASTLRVWDDMWTDIIESLDEGYIGNAEMIRDEMRKIFEFGASCEGVVVKTTFRIDY
jgi:hypothetical protein